jgi:hypothetical protein
MAKLKRYTICSIVNGDGLVTHYTSDSYDHCDRAVDRYRYMYPNNAIDIYEEKDMKGCRIYRNDYDYMYL